MTTNLDLQQRRAALSPDQRALLDRRLAGHAKSRRSGERISRRATSADLAPLSPAQRRLWFIEQLHPGTPLHNIAISLHLRGQLDRAALQRTIAEITRRHEALRTTFASVDGRPVQIVHEPSDTDIAVEWRDGATAEHRDAQVRLWESFEARRPFDLVTGPLIRVKVLRLADDDHVLLLVAHHIVVDGWSAGRLLDEIQAIYPAYVAGLPSPLLEPALQFPDIAAWQHDRLTVAGLGESITAWRAMLAGAPPHLNLPTDRPRPPAVGIRGGRVAFTLPATTTAELKALGRRHRATLFVTAFAAFVALLHRYTGQTDLVVGVPVAGRHQPGSEGTIGFLTNTLPVRVDATADPLTLDLLDRTRRAIGAALRRQDVPFATLVEALDPPRDPSRAPLVQVTFAFQSAPRATIALPGLDVVENLQIDNGTAKFDLGLEMRELDGVLTGWFEYSTALFDATTIERMAGHYGTLLASVVANPEQRLSSLPLLTDAERDVATAVVSGARRVPSTAGVHQLFAAQAARAPDAAAIVGLDEAGQPVERLTYRELDHRANRLAHRLQALGVQPDLPVGLCLERSADFIVGMLGILRAGGAYLPLDPDYPTERLRSTVEEASVPVIVTRMTLSDRFAGSNRQIVAIEDLQLMSDSATVADGGAGPDRLAYVMFTAGSTGVPKGVAVPHRAIVNLVRDPDYVSLTPADRVAQAANATFDAATFEIWGALLNGAQVVVIPSTIVLSPATLVQTLERQGVTVLFLTTAVFHQVARQCPSGLRGVRQVLFGGEAVDPRRVAAVLEHGAPERLLHVYGPTETTTFATWHRVERVEPGATTIPIGRPIAGVSIEVLDTAGQRVPVGVPGELYVGGLGVACGYLGAPDLTAERFLPDSSGVTSGERLYRTGDRVRLLTSGNLEFLSRLDRQVKVRGFRIEPGEIETALKRHPAVTDAIVVTWPVGTDDTRLVAYVVSPADPPTTAGELRRFLAASLPSHLVPAAFLVLDALPLTPVGKIDLAALPPPKTASPEPEASHVAPRTPIEAALIAVWTDLLDVEPIGVEDDFFDLGGHSLLVTRAMAGVRDRFGVELPVQTLFEAPTIAALAERIAAGRVAPGLAPSSHGPSSLVLLQPGGSRRPVFVVPGGQADANRLFHFARLAREVGDNRAFYGFLAQGRAAEGDHERPQVWLDAMAGSYVAEMRARQPDGPYLLVGACVGGVVAVEMARQLLDQGERVGLLALFDTWNPALRDRFPDLVVDEDSPIPPALTPRRRARIGAAARGVSRTLVAKMPVGLKRATARRLPRLVATVRRLPAPHGNRVPRRQRPRGWAIYQTRPRPFPGRIVLFANDDWRRFDATLGWEGVARDGVELQLLPGGHHHYLVNNMPAIAARLRAYIDAVDAASEATHA